MADTIRTRAALVSLLADNTAGAISPQDVRDLLESIDSVYGTLYLTATAATTTSGTPGTFGLPLGTTAPGLAAPKNMTASAAFRLTNDAPTTRRFHLQASLSMTSALGSRIYSYAFAKNGTVLNDTIITRTGYPADVGSISMTGSADLASGDYVELMIACDVASSVTTIEKFIFTAQSVVS